MNNYLIFVVGPTAIGKTALAIQLAKQYNCSIVSCDSRQFYKEMAIGTAVPSTEELAEVKHYFIQNKSIFDSYNVGDYEKEVLPLLDKLFLENNIQVVVGGSGLYVDAILKGFDTFPDVSEEIKSYIEKSYEEQGIRFLQNELAKLDPEYYNLLETTNAQTLVNQQRMKRFVGVCIAANKPYSSFLNQGKNNRNFIPISIGLEAPRDEMYQRINTRVDIMVNNGLLKEVASLKEHQHLNALQTVGYRELFDYLDNTISLDFAIEEIKKNTRRFAKRQLTWFKRNEETKWFSYTENLNAITQYINEFTK